MKEKKERIKPKYPPKKKGLKPIKKPKYKKIDYEN
jgi:hypothetical protein